MPDETTVTLADYTEATNDQGGGQYEQYIGDAAPTHDPFKDYPPTAAFHRARPGGLEALVPLLGVRTSVSASLAHNLAVRRQNIWNCWGTGVVVGWIGDASHQAECSDHNEDAAGIVHAIDPMVTGSRAQAIVDQCLAHPGDLQYVIHNRVIWSASVGWQGRTYTGSDPHTDHVHISGKHGGSNSSGRTCTGYDMGAQNSTPTFNVCAAPTPPPPPSGHTPGSRQLQLQDPHLTGADVLFVQRFIGPKQAGTADGDFGPNTRSGVIWYQQMRGITADGIVGPDTWGQMGVRWTG